MIQMERLRAWLQAWGARLRPLVTMLLARLEVRRATLRSLARSWLGLLSSGLAARLRRPRPSSPEAAEASAHLGEAPSPDAAGAASSLGEEGPPATAPEVVPSGPLPERQRGRGTVAAQPSLGRLVVAIRRELEAGRAVRATPRELRDGRGRRLRASAYLFGPEAKSRRGSALGAAGGVIPAAAKVALVALVAGATFLGSSGIYINYAAELPDARQITNDPLPEDTLIYAADGSLLADLHDPDQPHRYYQPLSQMGRWLPEATVAIEDANFWNEPGIDPIGILRAAVVDWRQQSPVQGGSTITQQLVKARLTGNQVSIQRKINEVILALQVERTYTKRQILEQYLNTIDYGNGARGALAAARIFFHKDTKDLDLAQASMLAGLPQGPSINDPFTHWAQAKRRQEQVLEAMVRVHDITQEEADEAYAEDISPPDHMFRPGPDVLGAPYFVGWVISLLEDQYGERTTFGGGLRVHTTVDLGLQSLAEDAIKQNVAEKRSWNVHQGAMVAIDPSTGAVLAMVGAADPNGDGGQFNMAVYPPRNPGSSMKVYTYTAAIASKRFTMVSPIADTPLTVAMPGFAPWSPKNYDLRYHGICQLQACMGNSLNVPAVKVEVTVGVDKVVEMARAMGAPPYINHGQGNYTNDDPLSSYGPALTLGAYGETPLQMATGVATLADMGVEHQPFGIQQVQSSDGTVIYRADPAKTAKQVLDPRVAFIMAQIMSDDANRVMVFGPHSALTLPDRRVAAKTGTTDDFKDAWTVGFTPRLASAFWFGNPDNQPMRWGEDAIYVAAPAWQSFMETALKQLGEPSSDWFTEPPGLLHAVVGGRPVWLLPGTSAAQATPPLPWYAHSAAAPSPRPSASPSSPVSTPASQEAQLVPLPQPQPTLPSTTIGPPSLLPLRRRGG
ncbi:MAG TPA: transglycosylase domain-containing protein [Candidatus Dormibacteraeota bacterium]|nr:transglycosylase domain-containing protein [Candidatus Dormibacteraeota bacterium]